MPPIEVPSPTFTFIQTYELPRFTLVHADLYRLSGAAELAELGFDDLPEGAVVLMEWPDRAAGFLPPDRLDIAFTLAPALGPEVRNVRCIGYGAFAPRAERIAQIRAFLDESGFAEAHRVRMQGDASTRIFERLTQDGQTVVLMNAPRRPDGPPVRDGKPYSAIAHLAEDIVPYVALSGGLARSRPLGAGNPACRYRSRPHRHGGFRRSSAWSAAIRQRRSRIAMPRRSIFWRRCMDGICRRRSRLPPQLDYRLPPYDIGAYLIEAELLLDWYLVRAEAEAADAATRSFRRSLARSARASDGCAADLDATRLSFAQSARGLSNVPTWPGSASSISRTR